MAFLEIDGLKKRFGNVEILKGIDVELEKGGFLVLVGPSGCGKSTLLNTIAGLEQITEGEIRVDGRAINDLHPSKRDIAMVFQSYALYPNMTVAGNIAFGDRFQPGNGVEQGGLAAAGWADQNQEATLFKFQVDALEDFDSPEALLQT